MPTSDDTEVTLIEGLGDRLRALMLAQNVRPSALGPKAQVSRTRLYRALTDDEASPQTVASLAKALGVSESELYVGTPPRPVQDSEAFKAGQRDAAKRLRDLAKQLESGETVPRYPRTAVNSRRKKQEGAGDAD